MALDQSTFNGYMKLYLANNDVDIAGDLDVTGNLTVNGTVTAGTINNAEMTQLRNNNASLTSENQSLLSENDTLTTANHSLTTANNNLTIENVTLTGQNETLTSQNQTLTTANETLTSEKAALTTQNETLTTQNETLTTQNETLTTQNENLTSENETLTGQNTTLTEQNQALTSENQRLTSDNATLRAQLNATVTGPWLKAPINSTENAGQLKFTKSTSEMVYDVKALNMLDTSQYTSFYQLFQAVDRTTSANTPNAFYYVKQIEGLGSWNTSNVTDMSWCFDSCKALQSLDISNWNTSQVTNVGAMFYDCESLTSLDLSALDFSNVTRQYYSYKLASQSSVGYYGMFDGCRELTTITGIMASDLLNNSKLKNLSFMFRNCYKLQTLDLTGWDTSYVTDFTSMFEQCQQAGFLHNFTFDFSSITDASCVSKMLSGVAWFSALQDGGIQQKNLDIHFKNVPSAVFADATALRKALGVSNTTVKTYVDNFI